MKSGFPSPAAKPYFQSAPALERLVRATIELMCRNEKSDEDVSAALVGSHGIKEDEADALVAFVPLAFCRVWLDGSGVVFAETYVVSRCHESEVDTPLSSNS